MTGLNTCIPAAIMTGSMTRRSADSRPFYVPEITCDGFTASGEKLSDKTEAETIRMDCDGQAASVLSVEKQVKTVQPPRLYDLTTLQRECNRIYGYTAQQTLDYVQSLYEKKLATYPRTDSQYLTEDMQATDAIHCYWKFVYGVSTTTADLNTNISSCRSGTNFCDISTFNQLRQSPFYSHLAYIRT